MLTTLLYTVAILYAVVILGVYLMWLREEVATSGSGFLPVLLIILFFPVLVLIEAIVVFSKEFFQKATNAIYVRAPEGSRRRRWIAKVRTPRHARFDGWNPL